MAGVRHWSIFLSVRRSPEGTSDGYHRFLHFLILDLHKSEVDPSNPLLSFFFVFKIQIFIRKFKKN